MNMDLQMLSNLSRYATPEVVTVFGALISLWVGWKIASKSFGVLFTFLRKFSFAGLMAAILCISGFGAAGLGFGEICQAIFTTTPQEHSEGIDNQRLQNIATDSKDSATAEAVLEYAYNREISKNNPQFAAIYDLAKKQMAHGNKETSAEHAKIIISLIELAKETEKHKNQENLIASIDKSFVPPKLNHIEGNDAPVFEPEQPKKMSVPWAMSLLGIGISLLICAETIDTKNRNSQI